MPETIIHKVCSVCKELKPISEFYKDRSSKTSYAYCCKTCQSQKTKRNERRPRTKEYRKQYRRTVAYLTNARKYTAIHADRVQARNAVSHAVKVGRIPPATKMLCCKCNKPAHEYHHYAGYALGFHMHIEPICVPCHARIHSKIVSPCCIGA